MLNTQSLQPRPVLRDAKIRELVEGGDWACSFARFGTLAHVCHQLSELIDDDSLADRAEDVARTVDDDLDAATHMWCELREAIRVRGRPAAHN